MKLTRCILVFLVIASMLLASCAPKAAPQETAAPVSTVAPAEKITLRLWDFGGAEFAWVDSLLIPEFEAKYPNIKLEHLGIPESDYSTKVDTAIAAGDVPDVALQSYMYKLWKAGHVLTLDDYMVRDGIKTSDFYPFFASWGMLDGKTYIMPGNTYIWAMAINKDLFKAAGLPELNADSVITYDDWLNYARAINKPSDKLEDRVFGSANFPPNWNSMNNYMSNPYVLGPDGKNCKDNASTADWIRTWQDLTTAYNEGLTVEAGGALIGSSSTADLFKQGKVGMMYATYGDVRDFKKAGINVGLVGQPVVSPGWKGNVGAWTDSYAIMTKSKHPEEAWLLLKFITLEMSLEKANGDCEQCGNSPSLMTQAKDWASTDPVRQDAIKLLGRVVPPPFNPDVWTAVDPFYEAFRLMTEEKKDVATTVKDASVECQQKLDELWTTFDELGK